jgi:hypothetical protein
MANTNPTKKQHFLPRFYLKRFADERNFLQVYDKKRAKLISPRPYPSVGYEHYFYAVETGVPDNVSQEVEEWLKIYEDIIAKDLPKIIKDIIDYKQISVDERYILSALMCMLWLRSPSMRDSLNRMHEDAMKQIHKLNAVPSVDKFIRDKGVNMTPVQRDGLIKSIKEGEYDMRFNNASHLRFMTESFGFNDKGFTNMFYGHKWKIYIAKGKKKFVTTDNPVVEWWLPPEDFWGQGSFLERTKYFTLTPEIFIELTYPQGSTKIKRKTLYESDDNVVSYFNTVLASRGGSDFAYANDKSLLEEIAIGRINPGVKERQIYEKYDYPWVLFHEKQRG